MPPKERVGGNQREMASRRAGAVREDGAATEVARDQVPCLDVKSVFCVFGLGLKTQCILCICSHKARIHSMGTTRSYQRAAGEGNFAVFREFSLIFRSFDQHLTLGVGHLKTGN